MLNRINSVERFRGVWATQQNMKTPSNVGYNDQHGPRGASCQVVSLQFSERQPMLTQWRSF